MEERLKPDYFDWVVEPFLKETSLIQRSWFGGLAYYLFGKLVLVTMRDEPPWQGLLVATEKGHHASLQAEIPELRGHPVLQKWLYLPEATEDFEKAARKLTSLILAGDPRIGVETLPKRGVFKKRERIRYKKRDVS